MIAWRLRDYFANVSQHDPDNVALINRVSTRFDDTVKQLRAAGSVDRIPTDDTRMPDGFHIVDDHLICGCVPVHRASMDALVALGVRTVVTLIAAPLTSPRIFSVHCATEHVNFADPEPDMLMGLFRYFNVRLLHLPHVDMGTMTSAQTARLIDAYRTAKANNEAIYVHCWAGRNRTWNAVRCIKHAVENIPIDEIYTKVAPHTYIEPLGVHKAYLNNPNFPSAPSMEEERQMLQFLAAALHSVRGGGGILDQSPDKKDGIFTRNNEPYRDADDDVETELLVLDEELAHRGQCLADTWQRVCTSILLGACDGDTELCAVIEADIAKEPVLSKWTNRLHNYETKCNQITH